MSLKAENSIFLGTDTQGNISPTHLYIVGGIEQEITEVGEIYALFPSLRRKIWLCLFGPSAIAQPLETRCSLRSQLLDSTSLPVKDCLSLY